MRAIPRHADRARQEQPVPRPQRRGESRSLPPHEGGRVPERRARAARQDRHGVRQHQSARSRALPHPARRRTRAPATRGDLSELRFRARPVGRDRARHAFDLHARVRGPPPALRLVPGQSAGALAPASVRVRAPQLSTYTMLSKRMPDRAGARAATCPAGTIRACRRSRVSAAAACRPKRSAISSSASASPKRTASSIRDVRSCGARISEQARARAAWRC